ncbi:MAG: Na+/H+ antiporter NhaA [Deltaproteobacteria bacterium]|nr:Na+/H+ antiporter NhaA [Deltaproteobacteria bacterium]
MKQRLNLLRESSVPLIAGVVVALAWTNTVPPSPSIAGGCAATGPISCSEACRVGPASFTLDSTRRWRSCLSCPFSLTRLASNTHLFEQDPEEYSTLARFEHEWKVIVDFGLFLFGLANAGVRFAEVGEGTWLVFTALLVGKTAGIFAFGLLAVALGFPLPTGVRKRALLVMGMTAGTGLPWPSSLQGRPSPTRSSGARPRWGPFSVSRRRRSPSSREGRSGCDESPERSRRGSPRGAETTTRDGRPARPGPA